MRRPGRQLLRAWPPGRPRIPEPRTRRTGFERVTFTTRAVSPEPAEKFAELARLVEEHCPVLDILRTPLDVSGKVEYVVPGDDRAAA